MKNNLKLNADIGEGMPNDAALMPYLSYVNIACGGHFGSAATINETIKLAEKFAVKVGAHPSYPDLENFGRKSVIISKKALYLSLKKQIELFKECCALHQLKMHHIKLHGALYNDIFSSEIDTRYFINWVIEQYPNVKIFVPLIAVSFVLEHQKKHIIIEAFADRNYNDDLSLVSRYKPKAILGSVKKIEQQLSSILNGRITTIMGTDIKISAQTLCIHGDHPLAVEIAQSLNSLLT